MTIFETYLLVSLIPSLGYWFSLIGWTTLIIGIVLSLILIITSLDKYPGVYYNKFCVILKYITITFLVSSLLATAIPSKKELAMIYLIPITTNTLIEQEIPDKLLKLLEQELNSWIEDTSETKT